MVTLRSLLSEQSRFLSRPTWKRRLKCLPVSFSAQICCLGCHLVSLIDPCSSSDRARAIDSTILRAKGRQWRQKHYEQESVSHSSIVHEAQWIKSDRHSWVYGWKLYSVSIVSGAWFPIGDNDPAAAPLEEIPAEVCSVLGDCHYTIPDLHVYCLQAQWPQAVAQYRRYRNTDANVDVRYVFHQLRWHSIEIFKGTLDGYGHVPLKASSPRSALVLEAVFVYQLALLLPLTAFGSC